MSTGGPRDSFVRWQAITIGQLTYAINLILTFSVATLGFQASLLLSEKFNPVSWQKGIFIFSLFLLCISVAFGLWGVINRLRDFRATAQVAMKRVQHCSIEEVEMNRAISKQMGACTWNLFRLQLVTFFLGFFCVVGSIFSYASNKLF